MTRMIEFQNALWACIVGVGLGVLCLISPLIPLAILIGGGFAIAMLRKPIVMCYIVVAAVVFLSGMPRAAVIPLFILNEPILAAVAGLSYFVVIMRKDNPTLAKPVLVATGILAFGTSLAPLVAYYLRGFALSTGDIFSLLAPLQYIVILWLFAYLPTGERERHNIVQWMLFCASIVAFVGILEAMNVGFVRDLLQQWYPSNHVEDAARLARVTSVLGAWNSLGNFLLINLVLVLALQCYERSPLQNLNMLVALLLCGACLLASGSFASLIGLFICILIVKWFERTGLNFVLRLGIIFAIGVALLYPLISARLAYQFSYGGLLPQTFTYRIEVWQNVYLPAIAKDPWFGVSPTFVGYTTWAWAESQYLYLLFRSGMVSLIAHLLFVLILLKWSYRRIQRGQGLDRMLSGALFSILVAFTIMGLTNEVFTGSAVIEYVWIILGLTAAKPAEEKRPFEWRRTFTPEPVAAQS